ncbi:MAG TPA: hypothetical protein VN903_37100 [Polyangia bacterium]|nr:hypothetical protein [Polyangia bacterium]
MTLATKQRRYWIRYQINDAKGTSKFIGDAEFTRDLPICTYQDLTDIRAQLGKHLVDQGQAKLGDQLVLLDWKPFEPPGIVIAGTTVN